MYDFEKECNIKPEYANFIILRDIINLGYFKTLQAFKYPPMPVNCQQVCGVVGGGHLVLQTIRMG